LTGKQGQLLKSKEIGLKLVVLQTKRQKSLVKDEQTNGRTLKK
jgi:hypothetical protein